MLNQPEEQISDYPPHPVKTTVMFQRWQRLTFLHWSYQPQAIRSLLPPGLELDMLDGTAWVGVTPFIVTGLRPPMLPALPWISHFPEMNVRTYVRGPDGEPGIWFFSLEASRLAAVIGARLGYGLPYHWARMSVRQEAERIEYTSRRHAGSACANITVRAGSPVTPNSLERFLTARFRLYTVLAKRLAFAQVQHPPWPLHSAAVLHLEQNVVQQCGLPIVAGEPLVHFSPGVHVRVGPPRFVR